MIETQRGGTLIGIIFGVLVGVLISFGVVWYLNKTPLPFVDKVAKPEPRENSNGGKPAALPGKPGDKPIDKDKGGEKKFEFYDILEGKKQATPGAVPVEKPDAAAPVAAAPGGGAYLQVGAFQKKADADNLKGRLAMLGFEAGVVVGEVPDKGTMHRVRIGPFANPEEMNRARAQLSQQGVPATVVRAKD